MKLPNWIRRPLEDWAYRVTMSRVADFILEDGERAYLYRWHIIPPNPVLSLYVHLFAGPDFGRHLHDHRSASLSLVLDGWYEEIWATPQMCMAGGDGVVARVEKGDVVYRPARNAHMVTRTAGAVTIFITGPTWRRWGFWVNREWVDYKTYFEQQQSGPK
ncbi:MAG: hypothetical protein AB7I42_25890 [Bradyrhizobium sp.]|uniref:hypothetical protein n=1 Tax=Bradyrhizobium sp. TaxID=376 RepID=UPI003D14FAAD